MAGEECLRETAGLGAGIRKGTGGGAFHPLFHALPSVLFLSPSHTHFPFILLYIPTFQSSLLPISQLSHTLKAPTMPQALAEALYTV